MATDIRDELVPLRTDFDVVLRGYERNQVRQYVEAVETELRLLATDRNAFAAQAGELVRQLEQARGQIRELRERADRICRTPIEPDVLGERLARMVELAHAEAEEITARARAAAEHSRSTERQAAERQRRRHERLVVELDTRRQEMEAEHRDLMRGAQEKVEAMVRDAERRRRELDEQAARLREQVESDFAVAMAARRAEADRIVRDATDRAHRMVAEAQRHVDRLARQRDQIAAALHTARRLLADAEPALVPLPEEAAILGEVVIPENAATLEKATVAA
jgi:cell division septum initiation protein DivIVA